MYSSKSIVKNVIIIGATGSIGSSSLKIIKKYSTNFNLVGFSYHTNFKEAQKIAREFHVMYICCTNHHMISEEQSYWKKEKITLITLDELLTLNYSILVSAIMGAAGVRPTYKAVSDGKKVILANKESLIVAGDLLMQKAKETGAQILPADSEHNSLYRLLEGLKNQYNEQFKYLYLTASGGPLLNVDRNYFPLITKQQVLKHPNWEMGAKITVDSAGLINKALEMIEAHYLFNVDYSQLKAMIHPQSFIHAIIQGEDGSFYFHASYPDMLYPLAYCLFYPEIAPYFFEKEKNVIPNLLFEEIDKDKFKGFHLGLEAGKKKAGYPIIFNASNEIAVDYFLNDKIKFIDIPHVIEHSLNLNFQEQSNLNTLEDILNLDAVCRVHTKAFISEKLLK